MYMTRERHLRTAEFITTFLDTKFSVAGIRFGLDPLLNVIPFFGPVVSTGMSLYLLWIAYRFHLGFGVYSKMMVFLLIDYLIGLIPFAGILGDLMFKANVLNLKLIRSHVPKDILQGEVVSV
jgi:hypothetical protein